MVFSNLLFHHSTSVLGVDATLDVDVKAVAWLAALKPADADPMGAAVEEPYAAHPDARPSLVEVAQVLAAQDGSPLAERHDLLLEAAAAMTVAGLDPDARDVVMWATAQEALRDRDKQVRDMAEVLRSDPSLPERIEDYLGTSLLRDGTEED